MKTVSERDISRSEAFLILMNEDFVEYSRSFRHANLTGQKAVNTNSEDARGQALDSTSWQEVYWSRDGDSDFQTLCQDYEDKKFSWPHHPKDINLREFMAKFTKNWRPTRSVSFVPVFFPTFKYRVPYRNFKFEDWCRYMLLAEKPGCYLDNVGKNFSSCFEELRDFVENSHCCPKVVKEEFEESLRLGSRANAQCPQPKMHELLEDQLTNFSVDASDNQLPDDWIQLMSLHKPQDRKTDLPEVASLGEGDYEDDAASDYDDEAFVKQARDHNWDSDMIELNWCDRELESAVKWLQLQKEVFEVPSEALLSRGLLKRTMYCVFMLNVRKSPFLSNRF